MELGPSNLTIEDVTEASTLGEDDTFMLRKSDRIKEDLFECAKLGMPFNSIGRFLRRKLDQLKEKKKVYSKGHI
jgi:hypothetical protein